MTDYYRHYAFGHVIRADATPHPSADLIAGTVVMSDEPDIPVGTYSTGWMRDAFKKTTQVTDTFDSMQSELDTLRIVLGVEPEPADTLPERMVAAAQRHRKAYDRLKEWCHESR